MFLGIWCCHIGHALIESSSPVSKYLTKLRRVYFWFTDLWSNPLKTTILITPDNNDIDMKLGPVIQLDKRNTTTSKKINDDAVSAIFPINDWFRAIQNTDSGCMQSENRTKKNLQHSSHSTALSKGNIFAKECRYQQN